MTKTIILFFIIAFNSSTAQVTQEWVAKFKDTVYSEPKSIATDNLGNSYISGLYRSQTTGVTQFLTLKYNSSGILQWKKLHKESLSPTNTVVKNAFDHSGNIYVMGFSEPGVKVSDIILIKYNMYGDSIWVRRYIGRSLPRDMVIDKYSNIYITAVSQVTGANYLTIKYNSSGNLMWNRIYNFGDMPASIALDSMQNVLVTGNGVGVGSNYNYITVKYDNEGNLKWARNHFSSRDAEGKSIACNLIGDIFVTGYVTDFLGNSDYATLKYDSTGNLLWNREFNREVSKEPLRLLIDSSNNCFVIGSSSILKYNSGGNLLWLDTSTFYPGRHCMLDNTGNLYITKPLSENTLSYLNTRKYGNNGNKLWEKNYGGSVNFSYEPFGLALDHNNNVFVTGIKIGFSSDTLLTLKYSQITGIFNQNKLVEKNFKLFQNYPNPFNPSTIINYELRIRNFVKIVIYNITGKKIITLIDKIQNAGNYIIEFSGNNLTTGIYFYSMFIDNKLVETKKMSFIK